MLFKLSLVVTMACTLSGCKHYNPEAVEIPEQHISLNELKHILNKFIPAGIQSLSENGREYVSRPFIMHGNEYKPATENRVRYYCKILVLNSSRPFDIQITVHREVRRDLASGHRYFETGTDLRIATLLKRQLRDRLAKRRDDMNLLDDFRIF